MEITVDSATEGLAPALVPEVNNRELEGSWKCDKAHLKLIAPHDHCRKGSRSL